MIRKLRVMQALPVIDESVGIGEVRFGMRPSQVKELMGEAMTWGPTADSRLEQIAVRSTFKAKWRGIELSQLTRAVVEELMNGGAKSRDLANRGSQLTARRFSAFFAPSGALTELSIGTWNDA